MADTPVSIDSEAQKHAHIFRKSVPLRVKLYEVLRALGRTEGQVCLDIGSENGMVNHHLRRQGGKWYSLVLRESLEKPVQALAGDDVFVLKDPVLPFKKKIYDAVVIVDGLERIAQDDNFIEECHKILKPEGRVVVNVGHQKSWSLIGAIRSLLKQGAAERGLARPGYTESQLFSVLKHGFDVVNVRSYSRFFVELVDAFTQFFAGRVEGGLPDSDRRTMRIYSIAGPFFWLAHQMDLLLFFTRGHYLVAVAKRRAWRPRKAPVLVDGRSISEVVLSRAAD
jgi:SAM-dependent methyltransferase